jgi:hypothetical protein
LKAAQSQRGDLSPSMWETLSTFKSHRSRVCNASMSKVSWHPGTLDHSRSWNVRAPCPTNWS